MGVYIGMYLKPHRTTQARWEAVYEEALLLAGKLDLQDGIVDQYPEVRESDLSDGTVGFYIHRMGTNPKSRVESICIRRNLSYYLGQAGPDSRGDVLFAPHSDTLGKAGFDCRSGVVTVFWSKTLSKEIHIAILALACLFADRLPDAVTIGCDIDLNQCREAVELANHYLENKIKTPVICRVGELMERLAALDIPREKQLCTFMTLYLGEMSEKVKEYLVQCFSAEKVEWYCRYYRPHSSWIFRHLE